MHAPLRPIAQGGFDLFAEVGVVDDDFPETGCRQTFQMPDDERLAAGDEQWFGRVIGERAHAFATPGGEDEGFHDWALKHQCQGSKTKPCGLLCGYDSVNP